MNFYDDDGLKAITVEGVVAQDKKLDLDGSQFLGVDIAEYYGGENFKDAKEVIISQLKYSTRRVGENWSFAKLYEGKKSGSFVGSIIHRLAQTIKTHSRNKENLKELLSSWYQQKAENHFRSVFDKEFSFFHRYKIEKPILAIRFMEKRWGSCSSKGKILLNTDLIRASKGCMRYVIIHELCHLIEPNHTKAFYYILAKMLPDYVEWKGKLEKMLV